MTSEESKESVSIMVRVSQDLDNKIQNMVKKGMHTSKADVVRTALQEYVNRDKYMDSFHNHFSNEMENEETRVKIKEIIRDVLQNLKV